VILCYSVLNTTPPKRSGANRVTIHGLQRLAVSYLHDVAMAAVSFLLALYLRLGSEILIWPRDVVLNGLAIFTIVAAGVFLWMRLHRIIWRYASIGDLGRIVQAAVLTVVLFVVCQFVYNRLEDLPRSFLVIEIFVLTGLLATPRFLYRLVKDGELGMLLERNAHIRIPVLLIGAGDGADLFIREMSRGRDAPYRVVGIIDDRGSRIGRNIRGVPVLGDIDALSEVTARLRDQHLAPQRILITRAQIDGSVVREICATADTLGLTVARIPRLTALDHAEDTAASLVPRPIDVEDVLGRSQTVLDLAPVQSLIAGRKVLITGAGGTIGGELARQVASLSPTKIAMLDASEYLLYQIDLEISERYSDLPRQALLGDIRDKARVEEIIGDFAPDIILHAAALKHVPLVEVNPLDGILTNVIGTRNVADAAARQGVTAMVLISTDKAVDPSNVMGATKRLAETYCQALDIEGEAKSATRFTVVRFGNVLGSTGSVIPLFQRQIASGGPLTVTHPEMTRYFMTVREAVSLVLQAAAMNKPGHQGHAGGICVLDMGEPVRILDLAHQMIRLCGLVPDKDIEIRFTGPRPGEKLHERLFHDEEALSETEVKVVRRATPRTADLAVLRRAFADLEGHASRRDAEATMQSLQRLVPEFTPPARPNIEAISTKNRVLTGQA
jgi:FlaA1/EpsC-like NDP-sugar epimerase